MAEIKDAYTITKEDHRLSDPMNVAIENIGIVFDEEKAKEVLEKYSEHEFDPLSYNRKSYIRTDGCEIRWTSTDPKKDGYFYRIFYEKCQIILL